MLSQLTSLLGLTPASRSPSKQTGDEPTIDFASVFARAEDEKPPSHFDGLSIAEPAEAEEPDATLLAETENDDALPDEIDDESPVSDLAEGDEGDEFQQIDGLEQENRGHHGSVATASALGPPDRAGITLGPRASHAEHAGDFKTTRSGNAVAASDTGVDIQRDTSEAAKTGPTRVLEGRGELATVGLKDRAQYNFAKSGDTGVVPSENTDLGEGLNAKDLVGPMEKGVASLDEPPTRLVDGHLSGEGRHARLGADLGSQSRSPAGAGESARLAVGPKSKQAGLRELPVFQLGLSGADQFPQHFSRQVQSLDAREKVSAAPQDSSIQSLAGLPDPKSDLQSHQFGSGVPASGVSTQPTLAGGSLAMGTSLPLDVVSENAEIDPAASGTKPLTADLVPGSEPKAPSVSEMNRTTIAMADRFRSTEISPPATPVSESRKATAEALGKSGPLAPSGSIEIVNGPVADRQSLTRRADERHLRSEKSAVADEIVIDRRPPVPSTNRSDFYSGTFAVAGGGEPNLGAARVTSPMLADLLEESLSVEASATGPVTDTRAPGAQMMPATSYMQRADTAAVVRQVAEGMARLSEGGVEIRLSPEELGQVRMQLVPSDTGMTVHVSADRPETLDLLRRHIDQLARDLADAGYDGASFTFSEGGGGRQDGQPPTDRDGAHVTTEDRKPTRIPVVTGATEGLDLRF